MPEQQRDFKVRIVTEAQLGGTQAAIRAQKQLNEQLKQTNDLETNGAGTQELNASRGRIDALFQKWEASKKATQELGGAAESTASGGIASLTKGLGIAAAAAVGLKAGFDVLLKSNPVLLESFNNLKEAVTGSYLTAFGKEVNSVINPSNWLANAMDGLTLKLGGMTPEMERNKEALEAMTAAKMRAQSATGQLAKSIEDQDRALKVLNEEIAQNMELEKAMAEQKSKQANREKSLQELEIEASNMNAEDKALALRDLQERKTERERMEAEAERVRQEEAAQSKADAAGLGVEKAMALSEKAGAELSDFMRNDTAERERIRGLTDEKEKSRQMQIHERRLNDLTDAQEQADSAARKKLQEAVDLQDQADQLRTLNDVQRADDLQAGDYSRREQELMAQIEAIKQASQTAAAAVAEGVSNMAGHLVNNQSAVNAALQSANAQLQGLNNDVATFQSGISSLSNSERRQRRLTQRYYY